MNRRFFLKTSLRLAALAAAAPFLRVFPSRAQVVVPETPPAEAPAAPLPPPSGLDTVTKTDDQWKALLTPQQYNVLRRQGTEAPYSSPLEKEHRKGTFACAGCDLPLFSSDTKFESGTGWPSFYQPLPDAIATTTDYELIAPRIEVHCRRCVGHLGHVFDDGPPPTGKRYCMNGVALKFIAD